jgi:hypothetical protein
MPRPDHDAQRLVAQPLVVEVRLLDAVEEAADHDLDPSGQQLVVEQLLVRFHAQLDAHQRVFPDHARDRPRHEPEGGPRNRADDDLPGAPRLEQIDLARGLGEAGQGDPRVPDQRQAVPVGPHAARQTIEER